MDISRTEYMPHHITESDNCFEWTSLKQNDEQKSDKCIVYNAVLDSV